MWLLATEPATNAADGIGDALVPLGILTAIVVVAWIAIATVRKKLIGRSVDDTSSFTLSELRAMRASGQLSDEEFERAHDAVVQALQGGSKSKITRETD